MSDSPRLFTVRRATVPQHGGMALVAVLWIVAALSVMTIGLSATVRQQIRAVSVQRDGVTGQALGEAAIALALQQLHAMPERPRGIASVPVSYAGVEIAVEARPLGGLISLNGAPRELLAAVFQSAGGLSAGPAQATALVLRLVAPLMADPDRYGAAMDPKTSLQELASRLGLPAPSYTVSAEGPDHDRRFTASVHVGEHTAQGGGSSKKHAEMAGALALWQALDARA